MDSPRMHQTRGRQISVQALQMPAMSPLPACRYRVPEI